MNSEMAAADLKYNFTCFLGIDKGMFSYINYQARIEWALIYDRKDRANHQKPWTLNSAVTNRTFVTPWIETSNFLLQEIKDLGPVLGISG